MNEQERELIKQELLKRPDVQELIKNIESMDLEELVSFLKFVNNYNI